MLNARIAEWILALVTTKDRAASTVGDLIEVAETHSVAWFWASVSGIAARKIAWPALHAVMFALFLEIVSMIAPAAARFLLHEIGTPKNGQFIPIHFGYSR